MSIIDTFTKITAIINGILIICAFILNPMVLFICLKSRKLRAKSTFKLLAFSSINDILSCLGWNQESFTTTIFNYATASLNLTYCRLISVFLQFTTVQFAAWMLVSISFDRFLSLTVKRWNRYYFSGYRPYIYASILASFMIGLNINEVFTGGYSYFDNDTEIVVCWSNPPDQFQWYNLMSKVSENHLLSYLSIVFKRLMSFVFLDIRLFRVYCSLYIVDYYQFDDNLYTKANYISEKISSY